MKCRKNRTKGHFACQAASPRRAAINPWFVALAVVVPTFMEVLDTTIANVALRTLPAAFRLL